MFGFVFHTPGTVCNRELRLRLGFGRVEQVGACTSLWRLASWRQMGFFVVVVRRENQENQELFLSGADLRGP
jgi:hypothetical protein